MKEPDDLFEFGDLDDTESLEIDLDDLFGGLETLAIDIDTIEAEGAPATAASAEPAPTTAPIAAAPVTAPALPAPIAVTTAPAPTPVPTVLAPIAAVSPAALVPPTTVTVEAVPTVAAVDAARAITVSGFARWLSTRSSARSAVLSRTAVLSLFWTARFSSVTLKTVSSGPTFTLESIFFPARSFVSAKER